MSGLVLKLRGVVWSASVFVAVATCTASLWWVLWRLGLEGGLDEALRFLSIPFILWMVVALAARPSGSLALRGILAFGLVAGLLLGMNSQIDVQAACKTGWVGQECEDFMRDRNATIPIMAFAWTLLCAVLIGGLWRIDAAKQSAA